MKFFLLTFLVVSNVAVAEEINCKSETKIEGWNASNTNDFLTIKAKIVGEKLSNIRTSGAYLANIDGLVDGKLSSNGNWIKYGGIEDAWCWYTLVMPADFQDLDANTFPAFINRICEDGYGKESHRLNCSRN